MQHVRTDHETFEVRLKKQYRLITRSLSASASRNRSLQTSNVLSAEFRSPKATFGRATLQMMNAQKRKTLQTVEERGEPLTAHISETKPNRIPNAHVSKFTLRKKKALHVTKKSTNVPPPKQAVPAIKGKSTYVSKYTVGKNITPAPSLVLQIKDLQKGPKLMARQATQVIYASSSGEVYDLTEEPSIGAEPLNELPPKPTGIINITPIEKDAKEDLNLDLIMQPRPIEIIPKPEKDIANMFREDGGDNFDPMRDVFANVEDVSSELAMDNLNVNQSSDLCINDVFTLNEGAENTQNDIEESHETSVRIDSADEGEHADNSTREGVILIADDSSDETEDTIEEDSGENSNLNNQLKLRKTASSKTQQSNDPDWVHERQNSTLVEKGKDPNWVCERQDTSPIEKSKDSQIVKAKDPDWICERQNSTPVVKSKDPDWVCERQNSAQVEKNKDTDWVRKRQNSTPIDHNSANKVSNSRFQKSDPDWIIERQNSVQNEKTANQNSVTNRYEPDWIRERQNSAHKSTNQILIENTGSKGQDPEKQELVDNEYIILKKLLNEQMSKNNDPDWVLERKQLMENEKFTISKSKSENRERQNSTQIIKPAILSSDRNWVRERKVSSSVQNKSHKSPRLKQMENPDWLKDTPAKSACTSRNIDPDWLKERQLLNSSKSADGLKNDSDPAWIRERKARPKVNKSTKCADPVFNISYTGGTKIITLGLPNACNTTESTSSGTIMQLTRSDESDTDDSVSVTDDEGEGMFHSRNAVESIRCKVSDSKAVARICQKMEVPVHKLRVEGITWDAEEDAAYQMIEGYKVYTNIKVSLINTIQYLKTYITNLYKKKKKTICCTIFYVYL